MAAKKTNLRSLIATIVKDFGLIDSLPYHPLTKADILGRFNGIRGVLSLTDKLVFNGDVLSESENIRKHVTEITVWQVWLTVQPRKTYD